MIMTEIKENSIDICVITETWLNTLDEAWVAGSEFNCDAYSVSTVNRKKGRGGGLALVYRRGATVKLKSCANKNTFEFAIREFKNRKSTINIYTLKNINEQYHNLSMNFSKQLVIKLQR